MEAPHHRENVLTALTQVPAATTRQIERLNQSLDPLKKASAILRDLEQDRLVIWEWYGREKLWSLSKRGRRLRKSTLTKSNNLEHMLAVGDLYFSIKPTHWLYEPKETFGKLFWKPDCVLVYQKKIYVVEVQLTPRGVGRWVKKWSVYNRYFNEGHFKTAKFQAWSKSIVLPQFLCITQQDPDTVKQGFEVQGRELIVVKSL